MQTYRFKVEFLFIHLSLVTVGSLTNMQIMWMEFLKFLYQRMYENARIPFTPNI